MVLALAVFVLVAGCGRSRFDEVRDGSSVAPDACTFGSFAAPINLAALNSNAQEFGPWISDDKLTIFFSSSITGGQRVYQSVRATTADSFGAPVLLNLANGDADDPSLSGNGLNMVFDHSADTLGIHKNVFETVRATTSDAFPVGQIINNVNDPQDMFSDAAPSLTADGLTMVFSTMRPLAGLGTNNMNLMITTRPTPSSGFAVPQPIGLNTLANEVAASLSADGSSMILISDAMGGISHIMRSERVAGEYQTAELLDPVLVGATGDETDPTLTPDGTTIVFVSNRVGGMGGYDVYYAERTCQ